MKGRILLILIAVLAITLIGADTTDMSKKVDDFYSDWNQGQIILDKNNFVNYYSLIRNNSDTLMIYLDGSGYQSVMGVKEGDEWVMIGNPYGLAKNHFPRYDFLAFEKVNVKMGEDPFSETEIINNYTLESRVNSAVVVINNFLENSNKEYKNIIIFGISQGGQIMPKIYNMLKHKDDITALIALGAGGLSQYEEFKVLQDSDLDMPPGYKEGYLQIEEAYRDIQNNPESVEKEYFGFNYNTWYGFMNYHPIEDYKKISIPILLLHGSLDSNSPVESSRSVKEVFDKLEKTNLTFIEYQDMSHGPESKEQSDRLFQDISNWLQSILTNETDNHKL